MGFAQGAKQTGCLTSTETIKLVSGRGYRGDDDEVLLNVLRCQLTYYGQVVTSAEARCNKSLRPRKQEGSLGRTAQDVHLDSHTAPELCIERWAKREIIYISLHCHHQNDSCIKIGNDENPSVNVSLIVRDKVTRQCPQTTTFLKRKES